MHAAALAWHVLRRLPPPLLAASAAGWVLAAGQGAVPSLPPLCLGPMTFADATISRGVATIEFVSPAILAVLWLVMLLAMMPLLLASPLLHVWRRSLTRRRLRAVMLFLLAYVAVWLAAGAVLTAGSMMLSVVATASGPLSMAIIVLVAVSWQLAPLKKASLSRCHRQPPLGAFGFRAEADVMFYGLSHGVWCVGSCWALMLLPLAVGGLSGSFHLPAMAIVTVMSVAERHRAPAAPAWAAARPGLARRFHSGLMAISLAVRSFAVKA